MRALALGGASCLWDDLEAAQRLGPADIVGACNEAGAAFPDVDVWATLHPEKLGGWVKQRADNGHSPVASVVGHKQAEHVTETAEYLWPGMASSGSSGLFVVKALLERGAEKVILCGIPMGAEPHFFDPAPWVEHSGFLEAWSTMRPHLEDRVRSFSGWTKDLLGEPTREWWLA